MGWDQNKLASINDGECNFVECKYSKESPKINFDADDHLPLSKP